MTELINLIDKIQDIQRKFNRVIFCHIGNTFDAPLSFLSNFLISSLLFILVGATLDLPQIVSVGGQSSGKTSVMESLVGIDFLPKGTGVVTRCPIVIRLRKLPKGESKAFCNFDGDSKMYYNFNEVREKIQSETNRIAGKNGVSTTPITITVHAANVVELSLIDLPGLIKVTLPNQPANMKENLRTIVKKYITPGNTILLAIMPAGADIATSDALETTRSVDPKGERTIGVLTKVDLMDKGTNCVSTCLGYSYPLKLGYIPVVNRSFKDVEESTSMESARVLENEFFENSPDYSCLEGHVGTEYLGKYLNTILLERIKEYIPQLKAKIESLLKANTEKLKEFNFVKGCATFPSTDEGKMMLLFQLFQSYSDDFKSMIFGQFSNYSTKKVEGGAILAAIFSEWLPTQMDRLKVQATTEDISYALKNYGGINNSPIFISDSAFDFLMKREITSFEGICYACLEDVVEQVREILLRKQRETFANFPALQKAISSTTNALIDQYAKEAKSMIQNLLAIEKAYINKYHPDMISQCSPKEVQDFNGFTVVQEVPKKKVQDKICSKCGETFKEGESHICKKSWGWLSGNKEPKSDPPAESKDHHKGTPVSEASVMTFRGMMNTYFGIVRKNLTDSVPKAIMHFFVSQLVSNMQTFIISKMYNIETANRLLKEEPARAAERHTLEQRQKALQTALDAIYSIEIVQ